jgi:hypothetical protein
VIHRWVFDDLVGEQYTVPINPNAMTKLKAARAVTTRVTTAVGGQTLFFEGRRPPQAWSFSGVILEKDHYDQLDHWVYDKGRIQITDHFLRKIIVALTDFDARPVRKVQRYWRHDYTIQGLVVDVDSSQAINPIDGT